jgi:EAL domain-containing protein (putative c-di-GMP-specific phosphodiesterase class I)/GGDEF domain-containing protein
MLNHTELISRAAALIDTYEGENRIFVFYADFAEFKLVNYYYGIKKGDELLDAVTGFVRDIPEVVLCERIFSDEFVFVVLSKAERTDAEILAFYEHYAEKFLETQQGRYPACNLRFCCGIAPVIDHDVVLAIDNANIARRDAKKTGATTAVLFTRSKQEKLAKRQMQEAEIMLALHEKRFVFYLQPKVDLLTGQIVGAEALARRLTPEGEIIYPDNFISILEENGAIVDLDYMILEQSCQHISDRLEQGLPVVRTSVNLSRLHVLNRETASRCHAIAEKYHVPPKLLQFELTESILLHEFREARSLGDRLQAYGYSLAVDDFGAGYTGVNIFLDFDFEVLKLDKKFISDDAEMSARNAAVISGVMKIAKELNIRVVCEGVERRDQCRYLLEHGCHYVQGFYFSPAVSPNEFYQIYQRQEGRYPLPLQERIECRVETRNE